MNFLLPGVRRPPKMMDYGHSYGPSAGYHGNKSQFAGSQPRFEPQQYGDHGRRPSAGKPLPASKPSLQLAGARQGNQAGYHGNRALPVSKIWSPKGWFRFVLARSSVFHSVIFHHCCICITSSSVLLEFFLQGSR